MQVLAEYPAEEILPFIPDGRYVAIIGGIKYNVKVGSTRLRCFKRSLKCVKCGVIGSLFRLERSNQKLSNDNRSWTWNRAKRRARVIGCYVENCGICSMHPEILLTKETPHLNLYAPGKPGWHNKEWVLMTQDHILPRCRGGKSDLDNLQTMCNKCNELKGGQLLE